MFVRLTLQGFIFASVLVIGAETSAENWNAGAAKIKITPEFPMAMAGYGGRDEPANGQLTELWAKALVIDAGDGAPGVVITLDLVGIERSLAERIRGLLSSEYGIGPSRVMLCTSHTHTGPVVGMNLAPLHYLIQTPEQQKLIDQYAAQLPPRIVELVGNAVANMQPCSLSWGSGTASFAVNRRENKPYAEVPQRRTDGSLNGPVDHDVPVLAVHHAEGQLAAVLFGYACHATVLNVRQWSGDYPGFAQIELESSHPGCVAMFWAGCGADQNPLPRQSVELAKHYGRRLADAVDAILLTSAMIPITPALATEYAEIELPLDVLPSREQIEMESRSTNRYVASRAEMLLEKLDSGTLEATYPYPISVWRIGDDVQWIGLGGEVVVDYALRLKTELTGKRTWIAGYCHDVMAYIPSRRVLREGGYEGATAMVYYGLPTIWAPEIETLIVDEVHHQIESTASRNAEDQPEKSLPSAGED